MTSTLDPPTGVPLYLRADGKGYLVTDAIGLRHGAGLSPEDALRDWAQDVHSFCAMVDAQPSSRALQREARQYALALAGGVA